MASILTFTGTPAPDWIATATDAPDPRVAGVEQVISVTGPAGIVLLVQWALGAEPDPSYLGFWIERARTSGLRHAPVSVHPDASVAEYLVSEGQQTVKGVPCVLTPRA